MQAIFIIGGWVSLMSFFDRVVDEAAKSRVAMYLFGYEQVRFAGFEQSVIATLMAPFMVDGELRNLRVFAFSVLSSFVVACALAIGTSEIRTVGALPIVLMTPIYALGSFLLDRFSLRITKRYFVDATPEFPASAWSFCKDTGISAFGGAWRLAVILLLIGTVAWLSGLGTNTDDDPIFSGPMNSMDIFAGLVIGLGFGYFTIFAVGALQLTILALGLALRGISALTHVNQMLSRNSRVHEHPFAFLGLLIGGICALLAV